MKTINELSGDLLLEHKTPQKGFSEKGFTKIPSEKGSALKGKNLLPF